MKKALKIILIVVAVAFAGYLVLGVWAYFHPVTSSMPDSKEAKYLVTIVNTRQALLTNKYDQKGKIITLYNYWEQINGTWVYRKKTFPLDQNYFGPVNVAIRQPTKTP